ncbi:MAG: hypothetical protein J7545_06915 [Roseofilum sp. SBFL]|uniref:hypothetical protein n=1 Tax=unclassified Roseofilum TaxID=2620099 RepID=UPI001B1348D1|nr:MULTISPECIES: hypothetical protein [unclassified Roseofilum]MBP0012444.1 hypothetical protein [Roseofilum sp. SID3]MBP0041689.1 hypothetical protein [Roseofilum sp. SBFL]
MLLPFYILSDRPRQHPWGSSTPIDSLLQGLGTVQPSLQENLLIGLPTDDVKLSRTVTCPTRLQNRA